MFYSKPRFLVFITGILFFVFLVLTQNIHTSPHIWLSIIFSIFYLVIMFILNKIKENRVGKFIFLSLLIMTILAIRIFFLNYQTPDYIDCLSIWVNIYHSLSFKEFLLTKISDYNLPYLYILFFISKTNLNSLYLIKLISIFFDIFLSLMAAKIVFLSKHKNWQSLVFILVFILPTVLLNSSAWAQCDVIYTSLSLLALYFFLKNKKNLSLFLFGFALSFKLQTVFILPLTVIFLFKRNLKLKNFLFLILGFVFLLIPPLIVGRGFYDSFLIYFGQIATQKEMSLNAPSIWSVITNIPFNPFDQIAILITSVLVLLVSYFVISNKKILTSKSTINLFFLFSMMLPYFLPRMHERYFYIAEVFSIIYVFFNKKRWYFPIIIQLSSLNNYFSYLFLTQTVPIKLTGIVFGILLLILFIDFYFEFIKK